MRKGSLGEFRPVAVASVRRGRRACGGDSDRQELGRLVRGTNRAARGRVPRYTTECPPRPSRPGWRCCGTPCPRRSLPASRARRSSRAQLPPVRPPRRPSRRASSCRPDSASCRVTATSAPLSKSIACSALCARCVRPSFILATLASGSWGLAQSVFEVFLLPRAIKPRQDLPRRRLDTRRRREARQIGLISVPRIPSHDTPHGGVGFHRRGIDRDRAALQEAGRHEARLDPRKHRPMRLHIDQPPGARNRRVIRGGVLESEAHEAPHRQRIRRAPGDAALRIEAFEVPHQQQAEVATWRQTRAAQHRRVKGSTGGFHPRGRNRRHPATRSSACRTDAPARPANQTWQSTTEAARECGCPWPCVTVYGLGLIVVDPWSTHMNVDDRLSPRAASGSLRRPMAPMRLGLRPGLALLGR